jgi:hypothetical protein
LFPNGATPCPVSGLAQTRRGYALAPSPTASAASRLALQTSLRLLCRGIKTLLKQPEAAALSRYQDAFETAGGCRFVAVSRRL